MSLIRNSILAMLLVIATAAAQNLPALTAEQKARVSAIKTEMDKKAAPLALQFAETTRKVYENMLSDAPDEQLRGRLAAQMSQAASALLALKGESIHELVEVLTPEQKAFVRAEMRKPNAPADLTELMGKLFDQP